MARAVAPTPSPRMVSASFTIQLKHLRAAEPDAPKASPEAEWPRCCRPTRQIIPSAIPKRSQRSYQSRSINFAAANWILALPTEWGTLTSVLLRALEQGPLEERMAKIEAALAQNITSKESTNNGARNSTQTP
jgi:hypothetical protein